MTSVEPAASHPSPISADRTVHRIRFVEQAGPGQDVLLEFRDPVPHVAVRLVAGTGTDAAPGDGIEIMTVPSQPKEQLSGNDELLKWVAESAGPGAAPPIAITLHGAQVIWSPARAAILAAPDRVTLFLLSLIDFCYYEQELRKLERAVGEGWPQLEQDSPLAYEVASFDPDRFEDIGQRMEQTLHRRIRLARIAPHLNHPRPLLSPLANQLMDRLREKAHVEDRHEALVSQLEVFECIYELNSQKISDFKLARQDRTLEWVIIVLLAVETLLLFANLLWSFGI